MHLVSRDKGSLSFVKAIQLCFTSKVKQCCRVWLRVRQRRLWHISKVFYLRIFKTLHSPIPLITLTVFCRLSRSNFVSSLTRIKSKQRRSYNPYVSLGADLKKGISAKWCSCGNTTLKNPSSDFYFFRRYEFKSCKNNHIWISQRNSTVQGWPGFLTMDQAFHCNYSLS